MTAYCDQLHPGDDDEARRWCDMYHLVPGVDYEPAVCDVCGKDEHTATELAECIASALDDPTDPGYTPEAERCPAGGPHEWGLLEEAGTGYTEWGCENCHAPAPAHWAND